MALKLSDISFSYASGTPIEQRALGGVSLVVEPGCLTLVLGPTGSGKSTLLRVASGLVAPQRGEVVVDGQRSTGMISAHDGGVGLVFQSPETQLFAETILDDVAFGPRNQGLGVEMSRELAAEALTTVGLEPALFAERSPFTLSGGEARRVALAGVLAMRPRYLLLDEPTAGLDAFGRAQVASVLDEVRTTGTGVVVVTHDAEQLLAQADDVLLLVEGRAAFVGTSTELIEHPEAFDAAGLRPPPVLEVLQLARRAGAAIDELVLDPVQAAGVLARARGAVS